MIPTRSLSWRVLPAMSVVSSVWLRFPCRSSVNHFPEQSPPSHVQRWPQMLSSLLASFDPLERNFLGDLPDSGLWTCYHTSFVARWALAFTITALTFPLRWGWVVACGRRVPTAWLIHFRWGLGSCEKEERLALGWQSTDINLLEIIPEGIPEKEKKITYLNENGCKISSSCWTFVRMMKFPLGSTPPLVCIWPNHIHKVSTIGIQIIFSLESRTTGSGMKPRTP